MKPELEALLKLLEAHLEGDPAKAEETYERYEVGINEYSATSGISASILDAAVRRKYRAWAAAREKYTSLPPTG